MLIDFWIKTLVKLVKAKNKTFIYKSIRNTITNRTRIKKLLPSFLYNFHLMLINKAHYKNTIFENEPLIVILEICFISTLAIIFIQFLIQSTQFAAHTLPLSHH